MAKPLIKRKAAGKKPPKIAEPSLETVRWTDGFRVRFQDGVFTRAKGRNGVFNLAGIEAERSVLRPETGIQIEALTTKGERSKSIHMEIPTRDIPAICNELMRLHAAAGKAG